MYLPQKYDNKKEDMHTARQQPAPYHVPQIRLHVAPSSLYHHRCAAKLPLCCRLRSGEERRPYSARCLQIRHDGKALRKACNVVAPSLKVVEKLVP